MLSIIIPSYNREDSLETCLKSIEIHSYNVSEVIVLVPEINERINTLLSKYTFRVMVDGSRENGRRKTSLWAIINLGIESAKNDWVCWLNDDCLVQPGWDKEAFEFVDEKTALLVLTTSGIGADPSFRVIPARDSIPCANYGILNKKLGIRFDENFSWFFGDADISMQVASKKLGIAVVPYHGVIHNHVVDTNRKENEEDPRSLIDQSYFDSKWQNWIVTKRNYLEYRGNFLKFIAKIHSALRKTFI